MTHTRLKMSFVSTCKASMDRRDHLSRTSISPRGLHVSFKCTCMRSRHIYKSLSCHTYKLALACTLQEIMCTLICIARDITITKSRVTSLHLLWHFLSTCYGPANCEYTSHAYANKVHICHAFKPAIEIDPIRALIECCYVPSSFPDVTAMPILNTLHHAYANKVHICTCSLTSRWNRSNLHIDQVLLHALIGQTILYGAAKCLRDQIPNTLLKASFHSMFTAYTYNWVGFEML